MFSNLEVEDKVFISSECLSLKKINFFYVDQTGNRHSADCHRKTIDNLRYDYMAAEIYR